MAVKPITNKHAVNTSEINRAEQRSLKNFKNRPGNRESTVIPGKDFTKNYAINIKDIDNSVLKHIKNIMTPTVREAGENVKVPVFYGNEERWVSSRKRGVLHDKKGSLILPLIMTRRTSISKNENINQAFKHDVKNNLVNVIRASKWSKSNRYTRFSVLTGEKPLIENILTGPADFVNITYEFVLWTNYMEQMNTLIELFVEQNDTYWGESEDYKFLCSIDSFTDASEMTVSGERFIKTTFSGIFKGYLLSEVVASAVTSKKFQAQKSFTPRKVVFGTETNVDLS